MSFSFYLKTNVRPPVADLMARISLPDIVVPDSSGEWPDGTICIYRAGISTRPTEITYEDDAFQVRILAFASPEDHELALQVVEQLAALTGAQVESEGDEVFTTEHLRDTFDAAWIKHLLESQPAILAHWAKQEGKTVTLTGPVRNFHIGPRLYSQLETAGPEDAFPYRLLEEIRRVQYQDLSNYSAAAVFEVSHGKQKICMSVWSPDRATHFPGTDFIHLIPNDRADRLFFIPYETLPEVAATRFSWLDEKQCLVEPVPTDNWPDVLGSAERFRTLPFEQRRKWWKPWA